VTKRKKHKMGQIRHTARTRKRPPIVREGKKKHDIQILCPNCPDNHPISITEQSHCGTILELVAVQTIYHGKSVNCMRCGEAGGTFMKIGENQYAHTHNCVPGSTVVYGDLELSKTAGLAWKLPDKVLVWFAKAFKRTPIQLKDDKGYVWKRL